MLMQLGSFQFEINTATYTELQRKTAWKWSAQGRLNNNPMHHHTGSGEDAITLAGTVYAKRVGTHKIETLRTLANQARPQTLVDGTGKIWGQFIITDISETQSNHTRDGQPKKQEFTLNLLRYTA